MRSPHSATLHFLNGRGTWDPGPPTKVSVRCGASLKNTGLKGPSQLRWVLWPPEQTWCPEREQQWLGCMSGSASPALLEPVGCEGGILHWDTRGRQPRLFESFPSGPPPPHSRACLISVLFG